MEAVECELLEECPTGALRIEAAHMGTLSSEPRVSCPAARKLSLVRPAAVLL